MKSDYLSAGNVNAEVGWRRESATVVLLRFENDDVEFRSEEENERDHSAEWDADTQRNRFRLATEVDGYEGYPYDARRVHGKTNELGFIEVLG